MGLGATKLVENVGKKRPAYKACYDKCHALFDCNLNGRRSDNVGRGLLEPAYINDGPSSRTCHGRFD